VEQGRRDAGTNKWEFSLVNLSGSRKRTQERVLMLRPVRPVRPCVRRKGLRPKAPSKAARLGTKPSVVRRDAFHA